MRFTIFIKFCLLFFVKVVCFDNDLKGQSYFSKSNFEFHNQYSISGGIIVNQGNYKQLSYQPNNKPLFNINFNAVSVKHFSVHFGLGYREKSLLGYGDYPWLRIINNYSPLHSNGALSYYDIKMSYVNADMFFKITFLYKYKLQPFVFSGARYNRLVSYSDSLDIYNSKLGASFKTRDKYINSFYGIGLNYEINPKLGIQIVFEQNNDIIPNKQVFFNSGKNDNEIRFLSYSFQIGIQYKLSRKNN